MIELFLSNYVVGTAAIVFFILLCFLAVSMSGAEKDDDFEDDLKG